MRAGRPRVWASFARRRHVARPIPLAAPVTSTRMCASFTCGPSAEQPSLAKLDPFWENYEDAGTRGVAVAIAKDMLKLSVLI